MDIDLVDKDFYWRNGAPYDQLGWLRANTPVYLHEGDTERGWPGFLGGHQARRRRAHLPPVRPVLVEQEARTL